MARCFRCRRTDPAGRPSLGNNAPRKQSLLGSSEDGQLCILPASTSSSVSGSRQKASRTSTPFITRISDELFDEIFVHAIKGSNVWGETSYQTALALSGVSKRFHRIVQPLMYRTIHIGQHMLAPPCRAVRQLHRTMKFNKALGSMVRALGVHVDCGVSGNISDTEFEIGRELLGWLPNVDSFMVHGGYEHLSTWPMISNAVLNWPRLKSLLFSREDWTLGMPPVCDLILTTPNLTTLTLHGPGGPSDINLSPLWVPPSKDTERSSNITHLVVSDFGEKPEALQKLLKLPRALEHFVFEKIHACPVPWRLDMFQWLLADHKYTLKSLEIGSLTSGYTSISLLDFPNLETLNLSHWAYRESPEVPAASLLAPRLHTFIWDFRVLDQHSESWSDFGNEQKEWLLGFAELAAEKRSALRKIEILFCPDEYSSPQTREELAVCVSPWDLMDEAKDKIKPLGIELEYAGSWKREGCLQKIEEDERVCEGSEKEET